ncbi:hypothetical protein Tco_0214920 [Tanacetum coccineum]
MNTPPPYKTSPLVDDDLDEEEALRNLVLRRFLNHEYPPVSDTKLTVEKECESVDSTKYRGMIGTDIETVVYADSDHACEIHVDEESTQLGICTFHEMLFDIIGLEGKQTALAYRLSKSEYVSAGKAGQFNKRYDETKLSSIRQRTYLNKKVPSVDNIADILTKALKRESFNYLRLGLEMMEYIP